MRNKKLIIILTFLIVAILAAGYLYMYSIKEQSITFGSKVKESKYSKEFECNFNYKNVRIDIEVDNLKSEENLEYIIKKPNGDIAAKGEVGVNDKINKKFELDGMRGVWKVEFLKMDSYGEFNYELAFEGNNK